MLKLMIIGHVGKDAEVREINDSSVIAFSVAHAEKFKDRNGTQQRRTTWVSCSIWQKENQKAHNIAKHIHKGDRIYLEGDPTVRAYESNNEVAAVLELRISKFEFLGGGSLSDSERETVNEESN